VVTGASSGIGEATARALAADGFQVFCAARRTDRIEGLAAEIDGVAVTCDVTSDASVAVLAETVGDRLDVLVNNAGGSPPVNTDTASPKFHEAIVRLNLLTPLLVAQRVNTVMQAQESGGVIVNISSVAALRPAPTVAAYGAAKAGVNSLTSTLAVEWAPKVRVNALAPGMVRTELTTEMYGDWSASIPLGRLAEPSEIGACAVFLASPLASYVSGATLVVHGGGTRE
jgi:NAD(P)-dependent dehydrogenase (short-subunit alcohol dehydrogenase family)